ncbi:energy-coupling factor transporter ATPase [Adlercreutzia sp. ZJ138]|uniref:energy-coupling factor transporter ATPase n=1 Tax=Adlercreutzia sp. ZJ138 TaxID=2709405 RepID=UPI0013EC44CD|nr:energy-coupling factor transporter ATPase [Adlercreutzia sp. ZJ138]
MEPLIECTDVVFSYDGERNALDGVTLRIRAGEFVCVLGGNGSGKSTFAKHLNALLIPDTGTVLIDGNDTRDPRKTYVVRSTCGMVFQNPDDQLVANLVEDDVAFGPENLGVVTNELRERVTSALREVGLSGFEQHETHALSGGQKQRVAIAGVLAMHPRILVLDEASAMLDPRGRSGLMRVCKELNAAGMTIVMITHFMEEAAEADRVVVLDAGRIVLEGTPDDVLSRTDVLGKLNLDAPFACDMSQTLQHLGVPVPTCVGEAELADSLAALLPHNPSLTTIDSTTHDDAPSASPTNALFSVESEFTNAELSPSGSPAESNDPALAANTIADIEHVSFAYDAPKAKRKRKSNNTHEKLADWGNSPDAVWALKNVSLTVSEGEFLGLAGHTGSGKSTLIQHLNGILHPTLGRVMVMGTDVSNKKAAASVRANVGVVFQYPEHQLFAESVYADVAFGPRNLGLSETDVDNRVQEALERVGLNYDELRATSPFELSGGQQRRVAFAGVLAMRPRVLVLDEPVAGLDPASRRDFLQLIRTLHEQGLTIVMVSHSMDDLAACCDRIAVMKEGELFCLGTPAHVFADADRMNNVGLGVPAAQRLANTLRTRGVPLRDDVLYNKATIANALAHLANSNRAGA